MKIAVCDDEAMQVNIISSHVSAFENDYPGMSLSLFNCSEDLIDAYKEGNKFDLIFLDIQMKQLNGIDAAAELRKVDGNVIIVFISAHSGYVSGAFNTKAFHYLLKPVKKEDFDRIFSEAVKLYKNNHYKYVVEFKNRTQAVEVQNIIYIESYKRKLTVHTAEGEKYPTYGVIDREAKKLTPYGFIRTHQGFLVNADYIMNIDIGCVHLKNGEKIPMSEHRKRDVVRFFNTYLARYGL